mmetsp:Transcript_22509/g.44582  ORF Transcript_22509/g.44582 Transcript_22509/m.44582 type:complete len:130 (+) Transcript_22509:263-652(+)
MQNVFKDWTSWRLKFLSSSMQIGEDGNNVKWSQGKRDSKFRPAKQDGKLRSLLPSVFPLHLSPNEKKEKGRKGREEEESGNCTGPAHMQAFLLFTAAVLHRRNNGPHIFQRACLPTQHLPPDASRSPHN